MREIKFRAWQKNHKKMGRLSCISFNENSEIEHISFHNGENCIPMYSNYSKNDKQWNLDDLVLMHYTGYLDPNEKPIFVGDILQTKEYFNEDLEANYKRIGVVRYADGFSNYDVGYFVDGKEFKDGKEWRTFKSDLKKARYGLDGNYNIKPISNCGYVIGNIYEHKHLCF